MSTAMCLLRPLIFFAVEAAGGLGDGMPVAHPRHQELFARCGPGGRRGPACLDRQDRDSSRNKSRLPEGGSGGDPSELAYYEECNPAFVDEKAA